MKVIILQENLHKALTIVSRLPSFSGQLPVLNTVLIKAQKDGLTFTATNLELTINYWVGAQIEETGQCIVPVKQFGELVSSLPKDKIELLGEKGKVVIRAPGARMTLNTLDKEEFPTVPSLERGKRREGSLVISTKELQNCISKSAFAASSDEARAVLTGILMTKEEKGVVMVATDGYRLSYCQMGKIDTKGKLFDKVIVPARSLSELGRVINEEDQEIAMLIDKKENQVVFSFSNGELISRLIDGEFPDYQKIIPEKRDQAARIDKEALERAVRLASIFARESANIVRFKLSQNQLIVEANAAEVGKGSSQLEVSYAGEPIQIAFNFRFLNDILKNISKEVVLCVENESRPGVFLEKGNNRFLHLIMPVRIQDSI